MPKYCYFLIAKLILFSLCLVSITSIYCKFNIFFFASSFKFPLASQAWEFTLWFLIESLVFCERQSEIAIHSFQRMTEQIHSRLLFFKERLERIAHGRSLRRASLSESAKSKRANSQPCFQRIDCTLLEKKLIAEWKQRYYTNQFIKLRELVHDFLIFAKYHELIRIVMYIGFPFYN